MSFSHEFRRFSTFYILGIFYFFGVVSKRWKLQLEVGKLQLEVGKLQLEVGNFQLEVGNFQLEVGNSNFTLEIPILRKHHFK